ncbi:hypothetical protein [Brachyspira alvinipulli]|uniref:hypothetical protein n=1 Tax=Brachyspira alvinipulli TaxID=84379 RepID=UPI0004B613FD|nr:hypothetical protein [Brachyspira alvinipulli]
MKNNKLFLKIYVSLIIIIFVAIIVLYVLGGKNRVGYLGDFKFDDFHIIRTLELNNLSHIKDQFIDAEGKLDQESIKNYIFTNENITNYSYGFRLKYYDKVFRNSDIYGVYIDTNKILQDNNFINEIITDYYGSPFGNLISSKKIDFDKIDNVNYILKIKNKIIIFYCCALIYILFLIYFNFKNVCSNTIIYNKIIYFINSKLFYYIVILVILIFSISVRLYWAYNQDAISPDEYQSISFSNNGYSARFTIPINNTLGEDILKNIGFDNASIKDCIEDIMRMHKNTNDGPIPNIYYILLRLAFIGRVAYTISDFIITGTILNCIFFVISFIALYKLLKLIFENQKEYVLFSIFVFSLSPISIGLSMYLRAYQLQETMFVIITYLVISTIYKNNYSIKNIIITTIMASVTYLTLYSSLLFILIISLLIFINYCLSNKIIVFNPLIKIYNYKVVLYYAAAFITALFVSEILYLNFFKSLVSTSSERIEKTVYPMSILFNYINNLSFNGLIPYLFIIFVLYIILFVVLYKIKNISILNKMDTDKRKILIMVIIIGLMYSIIAYKISGSKMEKYSATGYIFILFIIPLVVSFVSNIKIRILFFYIIASIYFVSISTPERFIMFEYIGDKKEILKENIKVYSYKDMLQYYDTSYLNTNLYYSILENENDLAKINDDKFYFLLNSYDKNMHIYISNYFTNYYINYEGITYTPLVDTEHKKVFKLIKKNN